MGEREERGKRKKGKEKTETVARMETDFKAGREDAVLKLRKGKPLTYDITHSFHSN
jgi:hypothetical protein